MQQSQPACATASSQQKNKRSTSVSLSGGRSLRAVAKITSKTFCKLHIPACVPSPSPNLVTGRFAVMRALEGIEETARHEDLVFTQHAHVRLRPSPSCENSPSSQVLSFSSPILPWACQNKSGPMRRQASNCVRARRPVQSKTLHVDRDTHLAPRGTMTWTSNPGDIARRVQNQGAHWPLSLATLLSFTHAVGTKVFRYGKRHAEWQCRNIDNL